MDANRSNFRQNRFRLKFFIFVFAIYILFLIVNIVSDEYREWVTDSWALSSKNDLLFFTLLHTLSILIIIIAAKFSLLLARVTLSSKYRRIWFALFFSVLGFVGFFAYFQFVSREDRIEFLHIPIIASMLLTMALGALFFKRKKRSK